jgi:hypothetical protein
MKEYEELFEAYQKVCEQVDATQYGGPDELLKKLIKDPKYGGGKVIPLNIPSTNSKSINLQKAHYEPEGEVIGEDIYDQVLEYLLGEGYSEKECYQIMVEANPQDILKFVGGRLATPLKTAVTDLATTAIGLTGLGKGKPPITRVPSPPQTQIVRQAPTKPPAKPPTLGTQKVPSPASQPRLSGSSSRTSLPPGTRGGAIVPSNQSTAITRTTRPSTPATQPRLSGSSPRASLPPGTSPGSITRVTTPSTPSAPRTYSSPRASGTSPGSIVGTSRVSTPATQPPVQQVRVRDITSQDTRRIAPSTKPSASLPASRTPGTGRPPRVGMRGLGGGLLGGLGSVVTDMIFPEPTADGTLDAAKKAGLVAPPAPKLPPPEKPKVSPPNPRPPRTSTGSTATPRPAVKPSAKPASQPPAQPEDPDLKKYDELRKTDPAAAKELGMKIWTRKYRPAFAQPEIA